MSNYTGIHRGEVADAEDPERRMRVRVRVYGVHDATVPSEHLPWAEMGCLNGGRLWGDLAHFERGDKVWVMFEAGDRRHPVVTGGWVSHGLGLNDVPVDITTDYGNDRGRWVRMDRVGNMHVMSEVPGELHQRLSSGGTEIILDQKDNSLSLRALSGQVRVEAAVENHKVRMYAVDSEQVLMSAIAYSAAGGRTGVAQIMANLRLILHADTVVDIGGYVPRYKGLPGPGLPGMHARQADTTRVRSRAVVVGARQAGVEDLVPVPETATVEVNGVQILVEALPATNLPHAGAVRVTIRSAGDVVVQGATKVDVVAPVINLTSSVQVNIT